MKLQRNKKFVIDNSHYTNIALTIENLVNTSYILPSDISRSIMNFFRFAQGLFSVLKLKNIEI